MDINFCIFGLGLLGFIDDLLKIKFKNSRGLSSKLKFLGQLIISLIAILILIKFSGITNIYLIFIFLFLKISFGKWVLFLSLLLYL